MICAKFYTSFRYRYTLFLAIDGNFKLQQKDRGIDDVELAPGWGYFVEEESYQSFIKGHVDIPEVFHIFFQPDLVGGTYE